MQPFYLFFSKFNFRANIHCKHLSTTRVCGSRFSGKPRNSGKVLLQKVSAKGCPEGTKVPRTGDEERAHCSARLRLMDLYCRHFFKRFRNTFETRRASHFSKIPARVWAPQKIAIDSPHTNDFELNHDPLAQVSHTRNLHT